MSAAALPHPRASRRPAGDLSPAFRTSLATGAVGLSLPILYAVARALSGAGPAGGVLKEVALAIHLATVVPALPLGAWVMLKRKGTKQHRLLGKVWLLLMIAAAVSAYGIRHLNGGALSVIHLLIPFVLIGSWRIVATARRGDIVAHRRALLGLFIGGLLVPALLALAPGRLLWVWMVG